MITRVLVVAGVCLALMGCTHRQLARSTVLTTSTVMEIQYGIVLMNLAMLSCHPEALPSHIDLADGVVQINDGAALGQAGGFTTFGGTRFGIDRYGPSASRQVTEQWGADATTDPQRLIELQSLYRTTLGLPPLPTPNTITYLRRFLGTTNDKAEDESKPGTDSVDNPPEKNKGDGKSGGGTGQQVPMEVLLSDVPRPGWYGLGGKKDVPKDACYVGHYRGRYAWVTPEGMGALARFTVTALSVVKYVQNPREAKRRGLAVTR